MSRIHDERVERFTNIDIYPVISSEFTLERDVLDVLRQIAAGGAKIVQLREKNMTKREILALAREYRRITSEYDMLLMINDHLDIALAVGADGVHLGQDDLPVRVARELAPDLLLGCSTHNFEEIEEAEDSGASCINIGPIFTTNTKAVNCGALGIDYLKQAASRTKLPFSVMGGIKEQHIPELLAAGASRIAMVTEITQAPDITARVRKLRSLMV